ncbi:MAG: phosphohistidine phosphatase SixA [Cyanobacteria bacterium P01_A01_bin.45]
MKLYLIRHGIAQERELGIADENRELTPQGREKTKKVASRLKELDIYFDIILTSSFTRALQTASILLETGLGKSFEESAYLGFEGSINDWIEKWWQVKNLSPQTRLALVGHEPCLSEWAEILLWGKTTSSLVLKKAGMIGIEVPNGVSPLGRCQMFWLTPPRLLI